MNSEKNVVPFALYAKQKKGGFARAAQAAGQIEADTAQGGASLSEVGFH